MSDFETHPRGTAKRIAQLAAQLDDTLADRVKIIAERDRLRARAKAAEARVAALEAALAPFAVFCDQFEARPTSRPVSWPER